MIKRDPFGIGAARRGFLPHPPRKGKSLGALLAGVLLCAAAAGCTAVSSDSPAIIAKEGGPLEGVAYSLPLYVMDFVLSVNPDTAQFTVKPSEPRPIASPHHRYYLRYHPLPNYDDTINVTVTPQGLLKSVSSNTTDKSGEIILNLVKSVSAFGPAFEAAAAAPSEVQLAKLTIDPANEDARKRLVESLNKIAAHFAESQIKKDVEGKEAKICAGQPPKDKAESEAEAGKYFPDIHNKSLCDEYTRIAKPVEIEKCKKYVPGEVEVPCPKGTKAEKNFIGITLKKLPGAVTQISAKAPDCSAGLCYRPPLPYKMDINVDGSKTRSIVLLPNEAPLVAIDIERAFFVNKVQTVEFDTNGMLKTMTVTKESELYALSSFPLQVVSAIAESLRLRVSVLDQQIANADSTRELIEAKADLEKQRVLFDKASNQAKGTINAATSATSVVPSLTPPATGQASFLSGLTPLAGAN
jgi:hypothetical protein